MKLTKNIQTIAKDVILNESFAIQNLATYVDEVFENCVQAILNCTGRVVVSGIGKSAIIGNKIVATLNSTGTPALFMHAADAIHGDLGMILPNDIVICISKSGNTPEIKVLVPLIKRRGAQLIGMVGNVDSYLAQSSDFVLNCTVEKEACPNNLAPTTSTTATLVMGDALAVSLLECRNFGRTDFAELHPGGALGKQLYLKVNDLSVHNEKPQVHLNATVKELLLEITSKRLGATAVVDDNNQLVGIITDGDVRRMLNKYDSFQGIQAKDIMTANPKTIDGNEFAVNALKLLQDKNITQVIVMEENVYKGFLHIHDLLREGIV